MNSVYDQRANCCSFIFIQGYGENKPKSSTTPQEVKPLDGIHTYSVAMGHGHTLYVARDETEEDKKKIEKLPEYTP